MKKTFPARSWGDEIPTVPPTVSQVDEPQPPKWSGLFNHKGEKLYIAPAHSGLDVNDRSIIRRRNSSQASGRAPLPL